VIAVPNGFVSLSAVVTVLAQLTPGVQDDPTQIGVAPEQMAAFCQPPALLHSWSCVLDVDKQLVCPDTHCPVHDPDTHVWFTQAVWFCHVPLAEQVCGCVLDAHCSVLGVQATQLPPRHAPEQPMVVDS
jgi:hypothetical protein